MQKNLIFILTALLALVSCAQPKSAEESHIYIISTNDMHANIEAMPRLATLVEEFEAKGEVVLVDSGDRVTGNAYVDDDAEPGIPMIELMNEVGYDVVTLGNHEFDKGREVLYAMAEASDFEWVCSNMTDAEGAGFSPYVTTTLEGVDIAFVGVVATDFNGRPMGGDASYAGFPKRAPTRNWWFGFAATAPFSVSWTRRCRMKSSPAWVRKAQNRRQMVRTLKNSF